MKELSEMTLEELWQLFPIVITQHDARWKSWAADETRALTAILADFRPLISHIGSTAIPGIQAKPIVDLLVKVAPEADYGSLRRCMEGGGYICMNSDSARMSFNKGYTPQGYAEQVFHIHVHRRGDRDEILFRDYLIAHTEAAAQYEALKLSLAPRFRHNRDGYTDAKSEFVRRIIDLAKNT